MEQQENIHQGLININKQKSSMNQIQTSESTDNKKIKDRYFSKVRYLQGRNIFQKLLFTWISPLLSYGYRFPLDQKAIPRLKDEDKAKPNYIKLLKFFQQNLKDNAGRKEGAILLKSIFQAFKRQLLIFIFIYALLIAVQMYFPILSHDVINYASQQDKQFTVCLRYFLLLLAINLFSVFVEEYLVFFFTILQFNMTNSLSLLIYNKVLKYPLVSEKQFKVSDIINYSQVDSQRLSYMSFHMITFLAAPLQIVFGFFLLFLYIGVSFLAGIAVILVLMIFSSFIGKVQVEGNDEMLKANDERMKVAEQMINIMKFIKFNGLEKYFFQKINRKRQNQLKFMKKVNSFNAISILVYWLSPAIIVSLTFLTYISLGNQITSAKAFFTIIIFNILQTPIDNLPEAISEAAQIWSSIKRIEKFLKAVEINPKNIVTNTEDGQIYAIQIQKGNYFWGKQKEQDEQNEQEKEQEQLKEEKEKIQQQQRYRKKKNQGLEASEKLAQSLLSSQIQEKVQDQEQQKQESQQKYIKALSELDIKFPAKKLTMIIGDIGSGKSSLLYAIINEMIPDPNFKPTVKINGSIAYSPQKPWIMAATVQDNITFFQPYDKQRFSQVLHYACLQEDIKILHKGVQTQIGEKGVNISGGQKARISLARALYSNKDIYLLDDILSAVDIHVGKFLMQKTIVEFLKGKTIIMPTHAIRYLQFAQNIIIMKKGRIIADGPYKKIKDCQQFQEIIKLQQKKQNQKETGKLQIKGEEEIINQLKLIKQATKSKEQHQSQQFQKEKAENTEKIIEDLILPQDHKQGQVDLDVYLEYIRLNGGAIFVLCVLFFMGVWSLLSVFANIQIQRWCEDQNKDTFYLYFYLILSTSAALFSGARIYLFVMSGFKQGKIIHKKMIKSLLYASITRFFNRVPVGRILNRLSKDLNEVDQNLGSLVSGTIVCIFSTVVNLAVCVYASTPFVIIPIFISGFFFRLLLRYSLKSQRQCVRLQNITESPIVSGFTSAVNGVATIRAYGLQEQFLNDQIEKIDLNKRMKVSREAIQNWFALRLVLISVLINMLGVAYSLLINNDENGSLIGLLLAYAIRLDDDLVGLAFNYSELQLRMISLQRVLAFTKLQPEIGYIQYCKNWRTKQQGADLNAIKEGSIQFRNYSTRYREGLPLVLKNISLKISSKRKVGIVGRTGAGKSTLMNSILRVLEPTSGLILIDGQPLTSFKLKDLRNCITMIEQQPTLFNGSFRENLDPANIYSESQINQILNKCNLAELVQQKGGIDSKIGNENLSVGQKQLLCICRAFLKKSKIILIDEATANIDVKNDKIIQDVITNAFKQSTVITIAHRLSTLKNCDQIIVLGEGQVIQSGETSELMEYPNGVYRKMCEQNDNSYLL